MNKKIIVNNRRVFYDYEIEDKYICGLRLKGTEIKSIRNGDCSISESFCFINDNEIFIKNMFIKVYSYGSHSNHDETANRKLLLTKKEIDRIIKKVSIKGYSIVPINLLLIDGWAKLEIGVGKGKKTYDKRNSIKERDIERDISIYGKY